MKSSSNRFTAKRPKGNAQPQPATSGASPWRWAIPVLCLVVAAASTWAAFEFVILTKLPRELLGKWVVVGGDQDGATFDFYRNGTMRGRINVRGREGLIDARVKVEDKVLYSTTTNPSGIEETRTQTIVTLTEKDLVLQDDRGQLLRLERAAE
jgi:uncharacterized protein (TIGR03066 family)